jgi:DNA-binding GntR family transcriptional regulator
LSENVESQSRLAYLRLERLIVTLQLVPGSMVTEKQLISLAAYGRTPVREAIQKLAWQGLIAIRPRAGLRVTALDPAHPAMIYEARRQLEPLAARHMAGNIDPTAREALIACAKAMTECSVTGDKIGFLDADKLFDEILERTCPNPFLVQALSALQTHARRYWFDAADDAALDTSVNLHLKVIRALLQADADAAEKAMAELIDGIAAASWASGRRSQPRR